MRPDRRDDAPSRLAVLGEIAAEIAHELRNVLQVISSTTHVACLDLKRGDIEAARPHMAKVEVTAHAAQAIVDDLMALAGDEPVHKEVAPLQEIVVGARADLAPGAARWNDAGLPRDLPILAHPRLLVRLFHLVYENAIHASAPKVPEVITRAYRESNDIVIEICDDGPGVPASLAERLFDPLVTARQGGTGLGLALARRIAVAHGGSIALLRPSSEGAGFRLTLPDFR